MGRPAITAIILTVRSTSTRLPNKVMTEIEGKPLLLWLVERFSMVGDVVIDTPAGDDIVQWSKAHGISCFEGTEDVTDSIYRAAQELTPHAQFVMRGLGDCPLFSTDFIKRSVQVMKKYEADAFAWVSPPFKYTVYGASEFPRSLNAWNTIQSEGVKDERQHPDLFYHRNREKFKIVYHEPPAAKYFGRHRLEIDWPEDVELIQSISKHFGRLPLLEEALDYLETTSLDMLNRHRVERTGLTVSYRQGERQKWWELMVGQKIVLWNDGVLNCEPRKQPIFCKAGTCLIGCTDGSVLYDTKMNAVPEESFVSCRCGIGRTWFKAK